MIEPKGGKRDTRNLTVYLVITRESGCETKETTGIRVDA